MQNLTLGLFLNPHSLQMFELIDGSTFVNNSAYNENKNIHYGGGAINIQGILKTLNNSSFESNNAFGFGGGINVWRNDSGEVQLENIIATTFR